MNWADLVDLQLKADEGDIRAQIYLDSMPAGARYNARLITKTYRGDLKKADKAEKKAKPPKMVKKALSEPVLTKEERTQGMMARQMERNALLSEDPAEREHSRNWLREQGL